MPKKSRRFPILTEKKQEFSKKNKKKTKSAKSRKKNKRRPKKTRLFFKNKLSDHCKWDEQTDRQTERQTHTLLSLPSPLESLFRDRTLRVG